MMASKDAFLFKESGMFTEINARVANPLCVSYLLLAWLAEGGAVWAAGPAVEFDAPATITVLEDKVYDEALASSDEKQITIRVKVSSYVAPAFADQVDQLTIALESPSPDFHVVDFLPRTTLESRYEGPLEMHNSDDKEAGVALDATGLSKGLAGLTLSTKLGDSHQQHSDYKLLPPKEAVIASGTTQRGHGVFFKLRTSPQDTLEGAKEFVVMARVPQSWRGDVVRVRCSANQGKHEPSAFQDFLVALHLAGDHEALQRAQAFAAAEQRLRRMATMQRKQIEQNSSSKLLQKIGLAEPSVPPQWLHQWLYGGANEEVARRLPAPVREAAQQYATSREQLHRLSGTSAARVAARSPVEN
jgi:hypothetical protein